MVTAHGYCWRWHSADGKTDSVGQFTYYHDCLADARANGYDIELTHASGETAPGHWALGVKPANAH